MYVHPNRQSVANGPVTQNYTVSVIESHCYIITGLIKAVAGVTVGGLVGLAMFRTGKGWRMAATTAGLGVAIGSTYERSVAPRFNTSE